MAFDFSHWLILIFENKKSTPATFLNGALFLMTFEYIHGIRIPWLDNVWHPNFLIGWLFIQSISMILFCLLISPILSRAICRVPFFFLGKLAHFIFMSMSNSIKKTFGHFSLSLGLPNKIISGKIKFLFVCPHFLIWQLLFLDDHLRMWLIFLREKKVDKYWNSTSIQEGSVFVLS